jgi:ABC-type lipoprotein export system ATPase subunit
MSRWFDETMESDRVADDEPPRREPDASAFDVATEPSLEYVELEQAAATRERPRFGGDAVIVCDNLVKIYKVAELEVIALQGLDLVVQQGEFVAIVGASGSGKSTLLSILGGLDVPSAGSARVAGFDLLKMGTRQRTRYRRGVVGFVWQQTARNLVPYLTARGNVELPMHLDGRSRAVRRADATMLLERVGLGDRLDHRPDQMSGGEQQRVAIAIALANQPSVIFADEPTGELDSATAREVIELLRGINEEHGVTVVVVTHDTYLAEQVNRTISIRDGRTSSEVVRRTERSDAGEHRIVTEEFAVLDRVGRLQLPHEYVDALELQRRVRLSLESDRINVWPDRRSTPTTGEAGEP